MGRIASLSIVAIYLLTAYLLRGPVLSLKLLMYLILALACIWFGDEMGSFTGYSWTGNINISRQSPGGIVRFFGWVLLILPAVIGLILLFH